MPHNKKKPGFPRLFFLLKYHVCSKRQKQEGAVSEEQVLALAFGEDTGILKSKANHFCGSNVLDCLPHLSLNNGKNIGDKVTVISTRLPYETNVWLMVQRMQLGR